MALKISGLGKASITLAGVGAITWLTDAWLNFNVVEMLPVAWVQWAYGLVGLAGIYALVTLYKK